MIESSDGILFASFAGKQLILKGRYAIIESSDGNPFAYRSLDREKENAR